MKKLPTYMLTRKFDLGTSASKPLAKVKADATPKRATGQFVVGTPRHTLAEQALQKSIAKNAGLMGVFSKLEPNFKKTLIDSFVDIAPSKEKSRAKPLIETSTNAGSVLGDLARTKRVVRVGVLDLGVWIGGLPMLLEKLNAAQPMFTIFEIQAPVPGGLIKTQEGMADWAAQQLGRKLGKRELGEMDRHIIANEFFVVGEDIRKNMGLDFLVGLAPALVAGTAADGGIYWNHFSSVSGKTILLSTTDLREFAAQAERPFEAAVGAMLLPALLIAVNGKLEYHDDSGCLFDYNGSRVSLVSTLKAMQIEDRCLDVMSPEQRTAASAMLKALQLMKRRKV